MSQNELMLFGGTPPYEVASPTSKAAAESIQPTAAGLRARILGIIAGSREGMTCDEVEETTGLKHQTASARIRELALLGVIQSNGKRPTRSGRNAVVWRLA